MDVGRWLQPSPAWSASLVSKFCRAISHTKTTRREPQFCLVSTMAFIGMKKALSVALCQLLCPRKAYVSSWIWMMPHFPRKFSRVCGVVGVVMGDGVAGDGRLGLSICRLKFHLWFNPYSFLNIFRMELIEGKGTRRQSSFWRGPDKYDYHVNRSRMKGGRVSLRCRSYYLENCRGRASVKQNGRGFRQTQPHCHDPEKFFVEARAFRHALMERCREGDNTSFKKMYHEERRKLR